MTSSTYRISDVLRAKAARTWGDVSSLEFREHRRLVERFGECESHHAVRLPPGALATRDMTAAGASGSNYLVGTAQGDYIPALQPFSAPLALGAQVVPIGRDNVAFPRGASGATAYWLGDEATQITESQPTIGSMAVTPKMIAGFAEVSHQALAQSNAEAVIRTELARAAAGALTQAILAGTGAGGQPLGIVNTAGIGSFTGAALDVAKLRNGQADIAAAILGRESCGYVTTPAVAETLASRQRFTGSDRTLWEGASHDGQLEGLRALTTTAAPASTLIVGDWSQCWVLEWAGGAELLVDPFTKFNSGIVAVRLLLHVDIAFVRPAAFSVATSVS